MVDEDDERADRPHDPTYRRLFTHPQLLRELLEDFVGEEVTGELDFERPEQLDTAFITESLYRRVPDLLWKIPRRKSEQAVYIYVLLELQSRVDPLMAVRMLVYVALIYERLGRQEPSCLRQGGMPPILPIVLYNGATTWTAQVSVQALIGVDPHAALAAYQPALRFYLIDERRLDAAELEQRPSLLANMFQLEQPHSPEELRALIRELARRTRQSSAQSIATDVLMWLNELLKFKGVLLEEQQLHSFHEVETMFDEKMEAWFKQRREEGIALGREEGLLRGLRGVAAKQLRLKFGVDAQRERWLETLTIAQLDTLTELLLSATDEAALRAQVEATALE
jgi:predicted transposase/invertase (TIGR01784 family)